MEAAAPSLDVVRQKSCDQLSGGRQRTYTAVLAPSLENPEIASVRPPRGRGLLLPRPLGGACERTKVAGILIGAA